MRAQSFDETEENFEQNEENDEDDFNEEEDQDDQDESDQIQKQKAIESYNEKKNKEYDTVFWSQFEKVKSPSILKKFTLPNFVKTFRVKVLGMNLQGEYGSHTSWITVSQLFHCHLSTPLFIRSKELIKCPLSIENNSSIDNQIQLPELNISQTIPSESVKVIDLEIKQTQLPYQFKITNLTTEQVVPKTVMIPCEFGFTSFKSLNLGVQAKKDEAYKKSHLLELPEYAEMGSLRMSIQYKSLRPEFLLKNFEKISKKPWGNNVQKLSVIFPLTLLLQMMCKKNSKDKKHKKMRFNIEKILKKEINKFIKNENPNGGGFGLFNYSTNFSVTAFAVWNFIEMNKFGDFVDPSVIDRSLEYLRITIRDLHKKNPNLFSWKRRDRTGMFSNIYLLFIFSSLQNYDIGVDHIIDFANNKYSESSEDEFNPYLAAFIALSKFGIFL